MRNWNDDRAMFVPEMLKGLNQWVCWDEKKIPINPHTLLPASTTKPSTWSTFDEARAAYEENEHLCGIGIVFTETDGIAGIDLDKGIDAEAQIEPWAQAIINKFQSYTEVSPSGTGVHIIIKGIIPDGNGRKKEHIEVYDRKRYFTFTGDSLNQNPDVKKRQEMLQSFIGDVFGERKLRGEFDWQGIDIEIDGDRSPPMLKYEALKDADKRFALTVTRRRTDLKDSSPSSYDMSLASLAVRAGWTDQEITDLIVYTRLKFGDELKRKDYYQRTINKARVDVKVDTAIDEIIVTATDATSGLESIRTITNLNIKAIIQLGKRDSEWILEFADGSTYCFGGTSQILSQDKWSELMHDMRAGTIDVKKKVWRSFMEAIQAVARLEDQKDLEVHEWLDQQVEQYVEGMNAPCQYDSEDFNDIFVQSRPFIDEDGNLNLSAEGLRKYLLQNGEKIGRPKVYACLRALGFVNVQLFKRTGSENVKRNYWKRLTKQKAMW